jgi:hypothetical protein
MMTILGEKTSFFGFLVTCTVFIWTSQLVPSFGRAPIALVCDTLWIALLPGGPLQELKSLADTYIHMIIL